MIFQPKPTVGWQFFILTLLLFSSFAYAGQKWSEYEIIHYPSQIVGKPIVHSSFAYVLSDDVFKVSLQTGKRAKLVDLLSPSSVPMANSSDLLFYGTDDGNIYARVFRTTALKWKFSPKKTIGDQLDPKLKYLTYSNDILYAIFKTKVYAFSSTDGKELWKKNLTNGISADSDEYGVYIADGEYIAFLPADGMSSWPAPNAGPIFMTRPNKNTLSNKIYVASTKGFIASIDASTGKYSWNYALNGWPMSTPVFDEKNVYFGTNENELIAVNKKNGRKVWGTNVFGSVWSEPLLIRNSNGRSIIVVGTNNNSLIALDTLSGKILWNYQTNDWVSNLVLAKSKTILVTTNAGELFALYASPICTIDYPRTGSKVFSDVNLQLRAWAWNGIDSVEILVNDEHLVDITNPKDIQFNYSLDTSLYGLDDDLEIQCIARDKSGLTETDEFYYKSSITVSASAQKAQMILAIPKEIKPETEFEYFVRNPYGTDLSKVIIQFNGKNDTVSSPAKLISPKEPGYYNITIYAIGYDPTSKILHVKQDLGMYMLLGGAALFIIVIIGFVFINKNK